MLRPSSTHRGRKKWAFIDLSRPSEPLTTLSLSKPEVLWRRPPWPGLDTRSRGRRSCVARITRTTSALLSSFGRAYLWSVAEHRVQIAWAREGSSFDYPEYSRDHQWRLSEQLISASAAPQFLGTDARADPEQAFVAALSSCHMLTFLAICSRKGIVIDQYEDEAVGHLEKNQRGKLVITRVQLRPKITFAGRAPSSEELDALHHRAHEECFLANSVQSQIEVTGRS